MSRLKAAVLVCLAAAAVLASPTPVSTEDTELRDLDVSGWECANQFDGTAQSQDTKERNRMKNRWAPGDSSGFPVEQLDTVAFLKKVAAYDFSLQSKRRDELREPQKEELDRCEN